MRTCRERKVAAGVGKGKGGEVSAYCLRHSLNHCRFQVEINEAAENQSKTKSTSDATKGSMVRLAHVLSVLVKAVCLLGLASAAFGPAYAHTLIRLVYGARWSETEAPAVLACYSVYILLLSLNGGCISEGGQ